MVCMSEAASSLDGLNKKYLTLDGAISTENVFQELKNLAGLQSNIIAEHTHNVAGWRWYDNHVALLVNLLRFYILSDLDERSKLSTGKFPVYDDGHVIIDLNDTLFYLKIRQLIGLGLVEGLMRVYPILESNDRIFACH